MLFATETEWLLETEAGKGSGQSCRVLLGGGSGREAGREAGRQAEAYLSVSQGLPTTVRPCSLVSLQQ